MTSFLAHHGVWAVFVLMAIDAVFPAASELVMLYGGALASGALTHQLDVFGSRTTGTGAYLAIALAGTIGYLLGSLAGWAIGFYGGRPFLERRGRWFHLDAAAARAGRALVRALGGLGGPPRPPDAGRPLVRLDPGRRLRGAASGATRC